MLRTLALRTLVMTVALIVINTELLADEPLTADTQLEFASLETGRTLVSTRDTFIGALSRFDRQVRLQTDGEATEAALLEFLAREVVAWDDAATGNDPVEATTRTLITQSIERLRPKLESFRIPLPKTVLLVQVSGKEEANAAYTRGTAIMLPKPRIQKMKPDALDRLLLHELFHVLSRNAPELRRDLYRIIGFHVCDPMALPPAMADLKLTNPDAPLIDCRIELTDDGEACWAAPILYSSSATYDAVKKPPLFQYLTFRLMKLEEHDGRWRPLLKVDEPILIDPAQSKSFADQIGQNTKYIIHPDEVLADNFVFLVMQTEKLPSPEIIERMSERLRGK